MNKTFFSHPRHWMTALLVVLGLGLGIRLYDLTDLPLDFHPTRQLLSALKARGMYYEARTDASPEQRDFAIQQWKVRAAIEPEVMERLVAFTYQFTGEQLWLARVYSSLFWTIGAVLLFFLARELASVDGALVATAVYLFLPYGIVASRSFQPDPLMTTMIIGFWWAVVTWCRRPASYKYAILAGLLGGIAIFIKFVAAFFVISGAIGAILWYIPVREVVRKPQTWVMVLLGILPGAAYMIYGVWVAGYLGQQFGGRFIPSLFLSPAYYLGWVANLELVIGGAALMLSLLGLFLLERNRLRFMLSLWVGYLLFGLYFNYHISSHDYYSLPLIPIVALSFAPFADQFFARLSGFPKYAVMPILFLGIFTSLWSTRAEIKSVDYRPASVMWIEIAKKTGSHKVTGLTEDYGSAFAYWGWKNLTPWPTSGDINYHTGMRGAQSDFEKQFEKLALDKDLFLVTNFKDLEKQPLLSEELQRYPIFAQGPGYVIYDLGQ